MIASICRQTKENQIRRRFRRYHEGCIPDNLLNKYGYSNSVSEILRYVRLIICNVLLHKLREMLNSENYK